MPQIHEIIAQESSTPRLPPPPGLPYATLAREYNARHAVYLRIREEFATVQQQMKNGASAATEAYFSLVQQAHAHLHAELQRHMERAREAKAVQTLARQGSAAPNS